MRLFLATIGLALWGVGVWQFTEGAYVLGGALVVAGGLGLVLAASRGWGELTEAVGNWLYFWR